MEHMVALKTTHTAAPASLLVQFLTQRPYKAYIAYRQSGARVALLSTIIGVMIN